MFNQANLSHEIERIIPALQQPLHTPECEKSVYRQMDVLSHYIADSACNNELSAVRQALLLADRLYAEGNSTIKGAIENVFVFSLSGTLCRVGANRKHLLALIPITLFTLYINQVMHKGC